MVEEWDSIIAQGRLARARGLLESIREFTKDQKLKETVTKILSELEDTNLWMRKQIKKEFDLN